jgi:hypothetical protein
MGGAAEAEPSVEPPAPAAQDAKTSATPKRKRPQEEEVEPGQPSVAPAKKQKKGATERKSNGLPKRVPGLTGHTIKIRQFDINMCKYDYTYVFFGRRRSGKSFLMRWLLFKLRKIFPAGLCVTKTKVNGFCEKLCIRFAHIF